MISLFYFTNFESLTLLKRTRSYFVFGVLKETLTYIDIIDLFETHWAKLNKWKSRVHFIEFNKLHPHVLNDIYQKKAN